MFRYVALVWDPADSAAGNRAQALVAQLRESATSWSAVLERNGLQVFCTGARAGSSEPYTLTRDAGVIVGKLYRRDDGAYSKPAPTRLSEPATQDIVASGARSLVRDYWGRYVAFVHDAERSCTYVLRDPSAMLPCLSTHIAGVNVYFSRMDDIAHLGGQRYSVNWKYVAAVMNRSRLLVHSTGLNEVSQVLGGECVAHREGGSTRTFYWNPLEIAASDRIENPEEAAATLRQVTRHCVHSWASSYSNILHLLSGGLDSSIILACLADAPTRPHVVCLNYYSDGCNTDEREYARLVAARAGCELIERRRNSTLSLDPLRRLRPSAIPLDYFFYLDEGRCEAELARELGSPVVFTGYGGDQLFYQARARFAAGDYLASHGLGPLLFEVALDAARVDRISVWSVLAQALRTRMSGTPWRSRTEPSPHRRTLLRDEVLETLREDPQLEHPWFEQEGAAPNGKRWHAYQLLFPAEFYNPLGREDDPEPVTPLLSQPLLELAMRIPTWVLTRGGWDRAIARRAFQHELPRQVALRRTKGGQEEHAKAILVRNVAFARELLLDGCLVRERIVEKKQLEDALSAGPGGLSAGNVVLFGCLSAEAWARRWTCV